MIPYWYITDYPERGTDILMGVYNRSDQNIAVTMQQIPYKSIHSFNPD